ncbi:glycosyltransferase family 87 protein [Motiliproteus sediminis]|uniref:glycosyltransferase family 87 protein n=1 Tax=Motiliproteus sediminis TaxID=1468178 RepID=UPI001AF000D8|nr:glycosyltransferase family 87 protein [Motiliproteus sediminis]
MTRSRLHLRSHALLFAAGVVLLLAYAGFVALDHYRGYQRAEAGQAPLFTDFTSTYAGSVLLRYEPAHNLYVPERMLLADYYAANAAYDFKLTEAQIHQHHYAAWMYPPPYSLLILPLARIPYLWAFISWSIAGLTLYLLALWLNHHRSSVGVGLAAPSTLFNLGYGQTGFFSAGLIGIGLNLLQRHPTLAGVVIGLAAFKPHLGLLIPLALAAGGYWWVFTTASAVVLALVASTTLAFGWSHWSAFLDSITASFAGIGSGAYLYQPMITPVGWAKFYGASNLAAWSFHLAVGTLAALLVWKYWRHSANNNHRLPLKAALLCAATLLTTPLAYLYDLTLLGLALAWLYTDMRDHPGPRHHGYQLAGIGIVMLALYPAAWQAEIHFGPLPAVLTLALCLQRWRIMPAGKPA